MVGAPGVGKSTMVRWLLEPFTRLPAVKSKSLPLVRWEPLARNGQLVGGHLGYTRGAFSGTDALGMAVNPQACRWMLESKTAGQLDFIVGEGARLANSAFFTAARARADRVLLVQLRAREETLDARCEVRGSKQNESWRRGARTRADNALAAAVAHHLRFGAQLQAFQSTLDQRLHLFKIERLFDEVERACFRRLDGACDRPEPCDHDYFGLRPDVFDVAQDLKAVYVRKL